MKWHETKPVMISINPHWCKLIADHEKTVEIRKTNPNQLTPFKVYVYATKPVMRLTEIIKDGASVYGETYHGKPVFITTYKGNLGSIFGRWQKVIGEFECTAIEPLLNLFEGEPEYHQPMNGESCLTLDELKKYGKGKELYGWCISNFVLYKEPKELKDFGIKKAPQSWCYVNCPVT